MSLCCCKTTYDECDDSEDVLHIWSYDFKTKWISKGAKPNTQIQVAESDEKQPWKVKEIGESDGDRLWSIYMEENGGTKLYASYESDHDSLTLQNKGQKQQVFVLGVAFNGLFLLKTHNETKNRFLKKVDNTVKVIEVAQDQVLDKFFEWDIVHPGRSAEELANRPSIIREVTMNMAGSMRKQWSHQDVESNEPVPVLAPYNNQQHWLMETSLPSLMVTFKKVETVGFEPMVVGWESDEVLLLGGSNPSNIKQFSGIFRSNGFILEGKEQNAVDRYIGISDADNTILAFHAASRAKVWFPEPTRGENFVTLELIGPSKKSKKMVK